MSTPSPWMFFTMEELACPCCGQMKMAPSFMTKLVDMRKEAGIPFNINSGYRCPAHDAQVGTTSEPGSGPHTTGHAVDIDISNGQDAYTILKLALYFGLTGVGVKVKGGQGFIHLDDLTKSPRPNVWSY